MHQLEVILQLQLGSDQAAVLSLPSVVSSLTSTHFETSPHLQKWIMRINSLIHSKHPGARWAGLCLAFQTSILSKDLMTQSAQNWVSITLPMLSRNESPPTWKACIRLLEHIFASAVHMSEFRRQIATPNVPKFSTSLISLMKKTDDREIRHASLVVLSRLIPLYPNLHRALHPSLYTLSLHTLSGSSTSPTSSGTIQDACNLQAVLHLTGGKVDSVLLWRKSLDVALANAWVASKDLRASFPQPLQSTSSTQPTLDPVPNDPVMAVTLSLDRLECSVSLINALLRAINSRPVLVPIGELVKFSLYLLRCNTDETGDSYFEATRRALEVTAVPHMQMLGSELLSQLARSVRHYLNPHLSRIVSHVTYLLEQPSSRSHYIPLLRLLSPLFTYTNQLHSDIKYARLLKAILPLLRPLLPSKTEVQRELQENPTAASRKGKKRIRGYEGDEIFKVGRGVSCPTGQDGEVVEAALDALGPLLSNTYISTPIQTLAKRLLVALLLDFPRQPPSTLSPDLGLHGRVYAKVLFLCHKHILAEASGWMNSAVGLVIKAVADTADASEPVLQSATEAQRVLDILLHPRLPPLLRNLPPVGAVMLLRSEDAKEDKATREILRVETLDDVQPMPTIKATTSIVEHQGLKTSVESQPVIEAESIAPAPSPTPALSAAPINSTPSITHPPFQKDSSIPIQISTPLIPSSAPTEVSPSARQEATVPSRPIAMSTEIPLKAIRATDSDEDDEEMPEIDMRSDSE